MDIKKIVFSVVGICICWFALDFVIHGMLLMGFYEQTASLWRPMAEMDHMQTSIAMLVHAFLFVCAYHFLFKSKTFHNGISFGCWLGVLFGFGMACMYFYLPIPLALAFGWFAGSWVEYVVAGTVAGYFMKDAS